MRIDSYRYWIILGLMALIALLVAACTSTDRLIPPQPTDGPNGRVGTFTPPAPWPTDTPTPTLIPTDTPPPTPTRPPTRTPRGPRPPRTPGARLPVTPGALVTIDALTTDNIGQTFNVQGQVADVTTSFSANVNLVLDDGTGQMIVILSGSVYKGVSNRAWLNYGAEIQVTAQVIEIDGVLQLQALAGSAVTILSPGSSGGVPVSAMNTLGPIGQIVAIEGRIEQVIPAPTGTILLVADATGSVRVRITQNLLQFVPDVAGLVVGAQVRVVGRTDWSRGLQVVPVLGYNVTIR